LTSKLWGKLKIRFIFWALEGIAELCGSGVGSHDCQ
jgi:hypothetical protein